MRKAKRDPICPTCTRPITDADAVMHHNCLPPPASEPDIERIARETEALTPAQLEQLSARLAIIPREPAQPAEPTALEMLCRKCEANGTDADCEHFGPQSAEIKRLTAERDDALAKLKASEWVSKDNALRTYDGLTTRHDRYKEALEQIASDQTTYDGFLAMGLRELAREALKENK